MKLYYVVSFLLSPSFILFSNQQKHTPENLYEQKKECVLNFQEKKDQLECQKQYLEENIAYLQDKINNEEAFGDEPAKLYEFLSELKKINRKLKRIARINQKSMCRFL